MNTTTHSLVTVWVKKKLLEQFDQVAIYEQQTTRSELLRKLMKKTVKKANRQKSNEVE